ncbi:globin domain-containing protein [Oceanomicrobium pacificus]|uniref:Globin domain-containing protein n=1 Tax=Oceanomicrobium pacificus TaxID=2692916 RepID=A0A6B0U1K2_9RHOB|nr:globin domain-containing protein [Oceanomicrobium pacificus]MXU64981.1 hypothetical protein [Oceanomicrobium pacificus]
MAETKTRFPDATAETVARVKRSFDLLSSRYQPTSLAFYNRLFEIDPSLRQMFRDDILGQGMSFMRTLRILIDNLENPGAISERYTDLGQGHALIGVEAEHFVSMEEALIETLREELGPAFDDDTETAWRIAFTRVAAEMMVRGGIA